MIIPFKFKTLTIIVFSMYIFWGSFGIDLTLHPDDDRYPLHRIFILLTAIIFLLNAKKVFTVLLNNKLLLTLLLYILLTAFWADRFSTVVKNFIFLSSSLVISILTALAFADTKISLIRWLFWLFLLMTLASIITAFYYPFIGINIKDFGKPRWVGITDHPNNLGVEGLALIWLSSNLFFLSKSGLEKCVIILGITAAFFIIIKADSMTSLITSIIIFGYSCYCYLFGQLNITIKFAFFFIILFSILFTIALNMNSSELIITTLESTGRNATFTGRTLLWEIALKSAADNIIVGYGFDNLKQLTNKYHLTMSHLHNGYIQTLVQGGLIAVLLLVYILLKTFFHQLKIKSSHKQDFIFLNTGLVMILLHNFTESSILNGLSTLGIFVLFIIVSTDLIQNNSFDKPLSTNQ